MSVGGAAVDRRVARTFPIPMRGNESESDALDDSSSEAGFPIPVRGNEVECRFESRLRLQPFPIPMRGNESEIGDSWCGMRAKVSDPHEG